MAKSGKVCHMRSKKRNLEKRIVKHMAGVEKKKKTQSTNVNQPKTAKDCSANWKLLCKELDKDKEMIQKKGKPKLMKKGKNREKSAGDKKPEVWFDDVPEEEILLAEGISSGTNQESLQTEHKLIKPNAFGGLTKAIGMDCEMVGTGYNGSQSVLARVSLVNQYGKCIYDKHVKAREVVTDYRTWVSGVRPSDLAGAEEFSVVQKEVAKILKGRILVGHALHNDLKVLFLNHPKKLIRDTAEYKPFRAFNNGRTPALKVLSTKVLGVQVQKGEHSSVQDAQAAMKLYMLHKKQWEKGLKLLKEVKK